MNGLVLVGGQSKRMGTDKSQLVYHGQPHWRYLYELLQPFCHKTFLSYPQDRHSIFGATPALIDPYETGPLGGILSAFEYQPNQAWLTIACDMPFITNKTIEYLINNRNPERTATVFQHPETLLPEPLLTIWEPEAYAVIEDAFQRGQRSPLQILQHTSVNLLPCPAPLWLKNINTPEDLNNLPVTTDDVPEA